MDDIVSPGARIGPEKKLSHVGAATRKRLCRIWKGFVYRVGAEWADHDASAAHAMKILPSLFAMPIPARREAAPPPAADAQGSPRASADIVSIASRAAPEPVPGARRDVMALLDEIDRLRSETDGLRRQVAELEALADTDPLAPVYNRRAFIRELERMTAYASRYGGEASLIYVDLDDFKTVNDRHGHQVGDAVLTHLAEILVDNVRQSDVVGRLGGDEFAIALANGGLEAAEKKVAILEKAMRETPVMSEGREFRASATFGAYALDDGESAEQALARADAAMYARKRALRESLNTGPALTR